LLAAIKFLTSLPLPGKSELSPEAMGRSTAYFPIVGLVIGGILAGLNWLLGLLLPPPVVSALVLAALVILTGAMHLDGFIDTCDGLGGHKPAEERWKVMHDSRAGAFGIVGAVMLLLVKYVSLLNLPPALATAALLFMPVVSRWAIVYSIFAYPYARPSGLGSAFKQATRWPQFTVATVITVAVAAALYTLCKFTPLLLVAIVLMITAIFAAYLKRRFAGLTGDTYGAINEVAEVTVLIFVIVLARAGLA
jgi:adenosylcobinamide-GDP ribazoletransferase